MRRQISNYFFNSLLARPAPTGRSRAWANQCVNVAGMLPVEAAERLQRLADKVLTGTAGRVELGPVALAEVKEPVGLVVDTDPEEVAAQAELLVGQLRVLRFLADAG